MVKRILGILSLLMVGFTVLGWAVEYPLEVVELTVEGNDRIRTREILDVVIIEVGDSIMATDLQDASQAIFDLGYFSEVSLDPEAIDEGRIVFRLVENPRIERIEIIGNDTPKDYQLFGLTLYRAPIVSDYKIRQILWRADVRRRSVLNQQALMDGANDIKEEYTNRGYAYINIGDVGVDDDGVLSIEVLEHPYGGSVISGLSSIPESVAEENVEIEVGHPLKLREFGLSYNALLDSIYFSNVEFGAQLGFDGFELWVQWNLTERVLLDVPTQIDSIEFHGNTTYSSEFLSSRLGELPGGEIDNYALLQVLEPVYDYYIEHGYKMTEFEVASIEEGVLALEVKEGVISEITISGLSKTKEYVVRRNIELAEGQVYNSGPAAVSYQQLMSLGYFRTANIVPEWTEEGVAVAITASDKANLGGFNGSMAIDPSTGDLVGELSVKEKNLFGTGQDIELSYSRGITATEEDSPSTWNLGYSSVAFVPGFDRVGLDLFQQTQDIKTEDDMLVRTVLGAGVSFAYPIADYANLGLEYRHEEDRLTGDSHWTPADVIEVMVSYNDTDDPYFPTTGNRRQLAIEKAGGFSAGKEYLRVDFNWIHFEPSPLNLLSYDMDQVLATRIRMGWADAGLPETDYYKLGGATTIRGHEPESTARMVISNTEYRIELTEGLQIGAFFDAGFDLDHVSLDEILTSTGIEFGINAGGIFVRLDLIWTLGEDASWLPTFDFGFGPMF